jgi:hypothetical protein
MNHHPRRDDAVRRDDSVPDSNLRAPRYHVAQNRIRCRHCGAPTEVAALALPAEHETLDPEFEDSEFEDSAAGDEGREDRDEAWQCAGAHAVLFYTANLPCEVARRVAAVAPGYRLTYSEVTGTRYWANHCTRCEALLEDHELHCEPGGAFSPTCEAAAAAIRFIRIDTAFEARAAGYTLAPEFMHVASRT